MDDTKLNAAEDRKMKVYSNRRRYSTWEQDEKHEHVKKVAQEILDQLITAGARFFNFQRQEVLYLDGQVIDIYNKADLLGFLYWTMKIDIQWERRSTAATIRLLSLPYQRIIPEGTFGTVCGIPEPDAVLHKFLSAKQREWLRHLLGTDLLARTGPLATVGKRTSTN